MPAAEFAYNNSKNASTGFTPFELDCGQRPRTPLTMTNEDVSDHMTSENVSDHVTNVAITNVAAANDFIAHWDNMITMAKDALTEAQDYQTKYANEHRRHQEFKVGDKVLLSSKHIQNPTDKRRPAQKLTPRFIGPYNVIGIVSPVAYKLELPNTLKIHPVFHVSLLKLYKETPDEFTRPTPPPPVVISDTEQEEFEVESILDKRTIRKKTQYLVKWLGYPLHDATWESEKDLIHAPEKLAEFESMRTLNLKKGRM